MEYAKAIEWLYGTQLFGIKLGLENVRRLMGAWGLPGSEARILHVAGTNGKGSVCALMESICRAAGRPTGLYTSPHLVSYCERIRVDGEMIPEREAAKLLSELKNLVEDWDPHPTFFELTTVLALRHFRERGVEVVCFETGLGGRLDATNAVSPAVSVITPIAMDHEEWLGDSLAGIAEEKAGIIKPGAPVVSSPQEPAVAAVLRRVAEENAARIRFVEGGWEESVVGLPGSHQRENAAVAVAALEEAGIEVPGKAIRHGLAGVRWRARFERIPLEAGGELIVDGAHNPGAAKALADSWREIFGDRKATIILGVVQLKDVGGILEHLGTLAERFIFTRVNSPRGVPPEALAKMVRRTEHAIADDARTALEIAERDRGRLVLVTGSLYLAGEILSLLDESPFEPSAQ